jgi:hypothetical protein
VVGSGRKEERRGVSCRIDSLSVLEGSAVPCPTDKKCHTGRHCFASSPPPWRPTGGQKRFPALRISIGESSFPNDLAAPA